MITTKAAALQYIQDAGWKIGKTQFYQHCSEGKLVASGGVYSEDAIVDYARANLPRKDTLTKESDEPDGLKAQLDFVRLKREKIKLRQDEVALERELKRLIPVSDYEHGVIGRAVALYEAITHHFLSNAQFIIDAVDGDQEKSPALVQIVTEVLDGAMESFVADPEYSVDIE